MSYLINQNDLPGTKTVQETQEVALTWGRNTASEMSAQIIDSGAVDAGNTPTTTLRPGLILAKLSTGYLTNYNPASTTAGQNMPYAILNQGLQMLDYQTGTVASKSAQILIAGQVKVANLVGFDAYARVVLGHRFLWDDTFNAATGGWIGPVELAANYTALVADNAKHFTNTGATGNIVLTLPTPAVGLRFKVSIAAAHEITLTPAAGGQLSINGNAAASTYVVGDGTTATIGKSVELYSNVAGTLWLVNNS